MTTQTSSRKRSLVRRVALVALATLAVGALGAAPTLADTTRPVRMLAGFVRRLAISDEQRRDIRDVFTAHASAVTTLLQAEEAARDALRQTVRQPTLDEPGVRAASGAVSSLDADLAVERARIFSEVGAVLTEEQKAEVLTFASHFQTVMTNNVLAQTDPGRLVNRVRRLTPEQRQHVEAILRAHQSEIGALAEAERETRRALRRAIQQPSVDEAAVRAASAAVAEVDEDFAVERARMCAEIAAVLTPEQRAQFDAASDRAHANLVTIARTLVQIAQEALR